MIPVGVDLPARRQEIESVPEVRQLGDDKATGALHRCRELEADLLGRSSTEITHHDVDVGKATVVVIHYHLRSAAGDELLVHLLELFFARPEEKVVAGPEHYYKEEVDEGEAIWAIAVAVFITLTLLPGGRGHDAPMPLALAVFTKPLPKHRQILNPGRP